MEKAIEQYQKEKVYLQQPPKRRGKSIGVCLLVLCLFLTVFSVGELYLERREKTWKDLLQTEVAKINSIFSRSKETSEKNESVDSVSEETPQSEETPTAELYSPVIENRSLLSVDAFSVPEDWKENKEKSVLLTLSHPWESFEEKSEGLAAVGKSVEARLCEKQIDVCLTYENGEKAELQGSREKNEALIASALSENLFGYIVDLRKGTGEAVNFRLIVEVNSQDGFDSEAQKRLAFAISLQERMSKEEGDLCTPILVMETAKPTKALRIEIGNRNTTQAEAEEKAAMLAEILAQMILS